MEDQLLNTLILSEKQDLEQQRLRMVEEVAKYRKRIRQLEDDLLFRLSNSKGNLLDDAQLIDVLAGTWRGVVATLHASLLAAPPQHQHQPPQHKHQPPQHHHTSSRLTVTKQTAQEVTERLQVASATNRKIVDTCDEYRPVARRAALLYFLVSDFANVNCMYQNGLPSFLQLYNAAIANSERSPIAAKRTAAIIQMLTWEVRRCRGIMELRLPTRQSLSQKLTACTGALLRAARAV